MRYVVLLALLTLNVAHAVKEIDQPIGRVFIPEGYDNNDSIQIVATGTFKNSCFQLGLYSSQVDVANKEIQLKVTAYSYENRCLQVEVPFFQTVHLGRLTQAGEYKIIDETNDRVLGKLLVQVAPPEGSGTDDTHYASMLDAFFTVNEDGQNILHLRGVYSNTCLTVPNVEIQHQKDVIVVFPYLHLSEGVNCKSTETPFEITKVVDETLPAKFLLHVRSMGGQALNRVVLLGGKK